MIENYEVSRSFFLCDRQIRRYVQTKVRNFETFLSQDHFFAILTNLDTSRHLVIKSSYVFGSYTLYIYFGRNSQIFCPHCDLGKMRARHIHGQNKWDSAIVWTYMTGCVIALWVCPTFNKMKWKCNYSHIIQVFYVDLCRFQSHWGVFMMNKTHVSLTIF